MNVTKVSFALTSEEKLFDTIYASKEWKVGDTKYFVFVETLSSFGKNESVCHVFHPASVGKNESFSWDGTKKVGMWGADVLNSNMAKVKPGQACMITLKPTSAGKKYYNFQVVARDIV